MSKDLFTVAAPLRKVFGVEPFNNALRSVHVEGEAFIHEMCHVLSLEHHGISIKLTKSFRSKPYTGDSVSQVVGKAIHSMSPSDRAENECEALAIEVLLLEANGHLNIVDEPGTLGIFLRDIWKSQPPALRRKMFNRSFRRFVLHILKLRDTDWIREAAEKVDQRIHYWNRRMKG